MAIKLDLLCAVDVLLKPPIVVGTGPAGTRLIFEVASARLNGPRLRGEMVGSAAADWALIGPEGTGSIDVRVTFRTHDGAIILAQYYGRAQGQEPPIAIYVAPRFETGDERYAWLNRIQAIGKGTLVPREPGEGKGTKIKDYEFYEVH